MRRLTVSDLELEGRGGESYTELVIQLQDIFRKWTADCKTVGDVG